MKFTILGASGFIGTHLVKYLQHLGIECVAPERNEQSIFERELGHVIYCVGLTADFRQKPFETIEAHVCYLLKILKKTHFESFLYLSSTRLYTELDVSYEDSPIKVKSIELNDLYNLSKMMGESICFAAKNPNIRIVRLSNVYGNDFSSNNFLTSLIKEAVNNRKIYLQTALDSEKDYVSIDNVVSLLPKICMSGQHQIYNVASGINTSNKELVGLIMKETNCIVEVKGNAELIKFPLINIEKVKREFHFSPIEIQNVIRNIIKTYQRVSSIR